MTNKNRQSTEALLVAIFPGEVVCDGEGEELWGEAFVGEAGPALHLVIGTQAEVGAELVVRTDGTGVEVVGEVGLAKGIFEVASPDHNFEIGEEGAIGAEVSSSDLVGTLVGLVVVVAVDLMELGFEAEVGVTVEVHVGDDSVEGLLAVIGFGGGVSDSDLEVTGPRGR